MKKLATFLVFGAVLAAGLPGQAMAADFVTVQCNLSGATTQNVSAIQASAGITLPTSCAVSSPCAQCAANLLSKGFKLANSFSSVSNTSSPDTFPYFVFTRGGGD